MSKAPDKIYVPLTINLLTKRQVLRLDATDINPISFANENILYIRKDALLEWAKEYVLSHRNRTLAEQTKASAIEELISKLQSL